MKKETLRQIVVIAALLATIVVNGLANGLPLNGKNTGEISDQFDVYFVPAAYVFSIWGLIYVALGAFAVYQALPAQRDNPRLGRIGTLFALSCAANIAWLFFWHYEIFVLTLVAMLALLALLILIYLKLDIGRARVSNTERWLVHVPFSIYLGWIAVATIANVTSLLDWLDWSGWGISPEIWTVIMLIAGAGLAAAMSFVRGDVVYGLVAMWAFVGIAIKHNGVSAVAVTAWVLAELIALILTVNVLRAKTRREPQSHPGD